MKSAERATIYIYAMHTIFAPQQFWQNKGLSVSVSHWWFIVELCAALFAQPLLRPLAQEETPLMSMSS